MRTIIIRIVRITLLLSLFLIGCAAKPLVPAAQTQLITVDYGSSPTMSLGQIDAVSQEALALWQVPSGGWINQIGRGENNNTLTLSYMSEGDTEKPYDRAGIYTLSLTDFILTPLHVPSEANHYYYNPILAEDGLFYVQYVIISTDSAPQVTLMHHDFSTQTTTAIAQDAIWPRLSPDGQRLTFISVDPDTLERGLMVTDLEGNNGVQVVETGRYYDVDSPLFSADSRSIYFTASFAGQKVSWLEQLIGATVAYAHADQNVPVDWMRVSVAGGEHERLSHENKIIVYGDLSPTGDTLYFSTLDGLYAMDSAGGAFTKINPSANFRTLITR